MSKSKKRTKKHYITKDDVKGENETWEQYFAGKDALKKFANKNKNERISGSKERKKLGLPEKGPKDFDI